MTDTPIIGIDPGKSGAIAIVWPTTAVVYDLPHLDGEMDYEALYEHLSVVAAGTLVVIEEQGPQGRLERTAAGGYRTTGSLHSAFELGKGSRLFGTSLRGLRSDLRTFVREDSIHLKLRRPNP